MKRVLPVAALIVLCIAGCAASVMLLVMHFDAQYGTTWAGEGCGPRDAAGSTTCHKVLGSSWGTLLGMPTAYWGLIYFLALGLWFVLVGRPSDDRRWWHLLPTALTIAGAVGSVVFVVIMRTKLSRMCTWCLGTHLINFAILALTLAIWPRRAAASPSTQAVPAASPALRPRTAHPPARLALAALLLAFVSAVSVGQLVLAVHQWMAAQSYKAIAAVACQMCKNPSDRAIRERPDDPVMSAGDGQLELQTVVFLDFGCFACRRFAESLDKEFNPLFGNHLRVVVKHFPLSGECNPGLPAHSSGQSCQAARAAEAARLQGGNGAFWKAHHLLFDLAEQDSLEKIDYRDLAAKLGLDPDRFLADMRSDQVSRRIQEDVELGRSLRVTNTPAIFVNAARVPYVAAVQPHFWQTAAQMYKFKLEHERLAAERTEPSQAPPG
jgi:protein-disulfide isomerase/uncharacterized membrane protein